MHQTATEISAARDVPTNALAFKALGDPTRLRLLHLLATAGCELCVCELVDCLDEPEYKVSRHLKALRAVGLVRERKEGRWVYHSLARFNSPFVRSILKVVSSLPASIKEQKELKKRLAIRTNGKCLLGIQKKRLLPGHKRKANATER